jgi:uroporphyrinogen-III synthase
MWGRALLPAPSFRGQEMSKKSKASKSPLTGTRVLVGRARHQASALSNQLRALGAKVLEIPFIEIRKPKSFRPLDTAVKNIDGYDWLILTSVNGVEALWDRLAKLHLAFPDQGHNREGQHLSRAPRAAKNPDSAAEGNTSRLRVAAIGPATKKAIEQRGLKVDVVPKEYIAESVVRSLRRRVKGKRVLLVRARVARDVIPRELRQAGAHVDVVEAYETIVPQSSRRRLRDTLATASARPHVITFTSSSTVRNFAALSGGSKTYLESILMASIGPVTSSTLRELGLPVHVEAEEYTIPGLVDGIVTAIGKRTKRPPTSR